MENNPDPPRVFRGHDPEIGILSRARHWSDLVPATLLLRTLRMAGSPVLIGLGWAWVTLASASGWFSFWMMGGLSTTQCLFMAATAGLGLPLALILFRQGALLTADRAMESLRKLLGRIGKRWLSITVIIITVPLVVIMIAIPAGIGMAAASWIDVTPLKMLLGIIAAIAIIPAAILASAGIVAIPLGLAAVVNERDPDPLDSLSRGYEYVLRGYLPLLGCGLLSALLMAAIYPAAWAIAFTGSGMVQFATGWIGDRDLANFIIQLLLLLPLAWMIVVGGGLVGGTYLMLRRYTGGQEIEDIWTDDRAPTETLPDLRT